MTSNTSRAREGAGGMKMTEELKPCPFCGGPVKIIEGEETAYVQCLDMKMHRALWFDGDNNAANEVADQWNTRPTEDALRKALRDLAEIADDVAWSANVGTMDKAIEHARALLQQEGK